MPDLSDGASELTDRRMALTREWDSLVGQVRALDGFEDFLRPPRLQSLLPAEADGPVAVINISQWRCDALIVVAAEMRVEELPRLTGQAVIEQVVSYLTVLQQVDQAVNELHEALDRLNDGSHRLDAIIRYTRAKQAVVDAERDRERTLFAVLAWLWDEIADPVLRAVGCVSTPAPGQPWPRLWWCPTGLLSLLPLHAAGHYDENGQATGEGVLDRVVSSYTPTLQALREAQRGTDPAPGDDSILVVALPETPGQPSLGDVAREREVLLSLFPGQCTILEGADATWDKVRSELSRHRHAHFSCHGGQDLADPSHGGLVLHDRLLTVADISADEYRGNFVFLSACMTATGGFSLPDEAITLAAALHYAGYRHVIGTLWSVYDDTAADVAQAVYRDMAATGSLDPGRSARALHDAVRGLRDSGQVPPSAWAPFTHTGP